MEEGPGGMNRIAAEHRWRGHPDIQPQMLDPRSSAAASVLLVLASLLAADDVSGRSRDMSLSGKMGCLGGSTAAPSLWFSAETVEGTKKLECRGSCMGPSTCLLPPPPPPAPRAWKSKSELSSRLPPGRAASEAASPAAVAMDERYGTIPGRGQLQGSAGRQEGETHHRAPRASGCRPGRMWHPPAWAARPWAVAPLLGSWRGHGGTRPSR